MQRQSQCTEAPIRDGVDRFFLAIACSASIAVLGCGGYFQPQTTLPKRIRNTDTVASLRPHQETLGAIFPPFNGQTLNHVLRWRNSSDSESARLKLRGRSCDCVNVELPSHAVGPNETTEITVALRIPYRTEKLRVAFECDTGIPERPVARFEVLADVYARVTVQPDAPFRDLRFPSGGHGKLEFQVTAYHPNSEPALDVDVTSDSDRLDVIVRERIELQENGIRKTLTYCDAIIRCPPAANSAEYESDNVERLHAGLGEWRLPIEVYWRLALPIAARPRKMFFDLRNQRAVQRTLELNGERQFAITAVSTDCNFLRLSGASNELARQHIIHCEAANQRERGPRRFVDGEIVVRVSDETVGTLRIPVFAILSDSSNCESPKERIARVDESD